MAEVFEGVHVHLGRRVAVKRFSPERSRSDPETLMERFLREGQTLAELSHQNIVGIHDLIAAGDEAFMILDYVDGADVATLVDEGGRCPVDVAVMVALKVADALQYAHFRRIIHRDIKGSNVMICRQGVVRLVDFGVALDPRLHAVTETGLVVGTPMFVAPELISGEMASPRSDLYSLGVLLYTMLAGSRPFQHAPTQEQMFQLILTGRATPLSRAAPQVPRRLQLIVRRLMHRNPDRRYGSAAEVRRELVLYLGERKLSANHETRLVAFMRDRFGAT